MRLLGGLLNRLGLGQLELAPRRLRREGRLRLDCLRLRLGLGHGSGRFSFERLNLCLLGGLLGLDQLELGAHEGLRWRHLMWKHQQRSEPLGSEPLGLEPLPLLLRRLLLRLK